MSLPRPESAHRERSCLGQSLITLTVVGGLAGALLFGVPALQQDSSGTSRVHQSEAAHR